MSHQRELIVSQASLQLLIPLAYLQYYLERLLLQARRLPNVIYSLIWLSRQIFDLLSNTEKSLSPSIQSNFFSAEATFLGSTVRLCLKIFMCSPAGLPKHSPLIKQSSHQGQQNHSEPLKGEVLKDHISC